MRTVDGSPCARLPPRSSLSTEVRISVIVPVFNQGGFVSEAIDSALRQSAAPHEVIVVDDGSTDATPDVLERFGGTIRVLRQVNRGVAAARNAGVAASSGHALAFLDADDTWETGKLEKQRARLAADPSLGLVHCGVTEVDAEGRALATRLDGMEGSVWQEMLLFRRSVVLGGGSGALIPRAAFDTAGGFDEDLSTSADWDLYYRLARRFGVAFVREPLVRYRIHGENMHANVRVMERDMLRAYSKAFAEEDPALRRLRRRAYGALRSVLAGSYFRAGDHGRFCANAAAATLETPSVVLRFAAFPFKRWRRR